MLSGPRRRFALGVLLLIVASVGLAAAGGRWQLLETRRHVEVEIGNVDGIAELFVDCRLVARVETGEPNETVDLWLKPADRIYISTTSIDDTPAWSFTGRSNGKKLFDESRGTTESPKFTTPAHAVVFAKAFLPSPGAKMGAVGCQPPRIAVVAGYTWSPDDKDAPAVSADEPLYRPSPAYYGWLDAGGRWSLVALAILGAIAALSMASIRRFVRTHWGEFAGVGLGLLGLGIVASVLPTILIAGGVTLLFYVAVRACTQP